MDEQKKLSLDETEPGICFLGCFINQNLKKSKLKLEFSKIIRETLVLFRTKSKKYLKKEYVRTHIIRLFKKTVREILSPKKSSKNPLKQLKNLSSSQAKAYEKFSTYIKDFKESIENHVATEAGPCTDGKKKRPAINSSIARSYNDNHIKEYFSKRIVRESFSYFIDYVFAKEDSSNLVNNLKYLCCLEPEHSDKCTSNWLRLKEFYQVIMIEELYIFDNIPSCDSCIGNDCQCIFSDSSFHGVKDIEEDIEVFLD
ncbi:hypothetical protein SteCoe_10639 [Stentor coeruleus]|uniref:Uncharacterized protein n=1 Tax=Stentor coeruleus TaxID=5963 RepID=A0A1R2CF41_9CILI|nr:hypothetical protein SteCoe_10639 [Stentor coeruleus]